MRYRDFIMPKRSEVDRPEEPLRRKRIQLKWDTRKFLRAGGQIDNLSDGEISEAHLSYEKVNQQDFNRRNIKKNPGHGLTISIR